ncbi:MAG TPA: hypothetical protein PKA64_11265, partial [Myxococcota bacterium]|nr:hypothetical protein [Myxococcota bacterium]
MTSSLRLLLPLLLVACYGDTPSGKDSGDDSDPDTPADDTDAPPDDTLPPATLPTPTVRFVDASPTSTDDLVAEVVSPDPEATYTWAWKLDGAAQADLTDPRVLGSRTLRGQTWEALATAHKGDEVSAPGSAQVVVRNAAPYATVAITPEAPTTEAPLVAVPTPGDPDGDAVTFTWQWRVDGLLTGNTGATVPAGVPLKGQTWEVTATPRDDQEDGEPARASIVIGDAPPRVNNVVVLPEAPRTDTPLTASAGAVDPDNDRLTTTWAWYVNGVLVNGATTNRLDAARFAKGDRVAAEATASDGQLTSAPVRSAELVIGNTAPALQDVRLTPEVADAATTLTCAPSGYTDLDGDPQGARLRWLINGVELAGQTGATLGAPHLRRDQAVTCAAAPFDGTDAGEELLSNVVTIRNSAPRIGSVSLSTQSPADGESITAQAVGVIDDDGDRVTIGWQWYVNGNAAGLLDRLPAGSFGAGDRIWVVATPSDGTDSGAPVRSADAFGANTPPEAYNVRISPSSPHTDDVLVASADGRDVDHHQVTFRWRWAVDGQEVAGATTNLLDDSLFHKGQRVVATATPWDGYAEGAAVASPPVQIRNSAPSLEAAQISPSEVYETSTLTCAGSGWSDADGDPPAWHTAWTVNGVAAGTSDTLDGAAFSRGDTIRCQLQPDDGENIGGTVTSAAVQVRNTPPVADAARLSDTQPGVNTTLSVTVDGARDVDGDDVWFTYVWRVDGDAVATTATLPGPHPRGGHIDVEVTP